MIQAIRHVSFVVCPAYASMCTFIEHYRYRLVFIRCSIAVLVFLILRYISRLDYRLITFVWAEALRTSIRAAPVSTRSRKVPVPGP